MAQVVLLTDVTQSTNDSGWGRAIGSYVLASKARRAGFSAVVIDYFTKLNDLEAVLMAAIGPETLFVGISGTFLSNDDYVDPLPQSVRILEYGSGFLWCSTQAELKAFIAKIRSILELRKAPQSTPIVLGGTKALYALQTEPMRPIFDFYAIGKGESYFVEMLQLLAAGEPLPFGEHLGAKYIHEKSFGQTTESIESLQWAKTDAILSTAGLPIEIAKGCLYNCKFCNYEKQGSLRQNVDSLKAEFIRNYEHFGTTRYSFCDDCFNDTRPKVEEICNSILSLPFKIEWVSYARVDVACKFPHTLELMIESGARGLFWGLETLNHEIGRKIGKGTDPELIKKMFLDVREKHGDRCIMQGAFIIGLPGETKESIRATFDWVIESRALHIAYMSVLGLRPYSERLDKAVIDYADFSRNPDKYGFKSISFDPVDWEHETMNRTEAYAMRAEILKRMRDANYSISFMSSVFQYSNLRDVGLTHDEIVDAIRNGRRDGPIHVDVIEREKRALVDYRSRLFNSLSEERAVASDFRTALRT